ncbi:AI-2E family transporter [Halobacteriaceae archaeon GCM10025711]
MNVVQDIFDQSLNYVGFVGNAALHLFIMIGIAFYLLRDDERLGVWFRRRFADEDGVVETYARQVDHDFSNIFFGNILNAALTGIIGAISYNALAMVAPPSLPIPYPTLLGLLTGIASLVPVIGMKLIYVPVGAYLSVLAVNTSPRLLWFPTLFVTVSFLIVDVIPDLVLRPYVSGRGLHLGMVMFAYIFGPLLFGWYGIFLGPMLLVLLVHFVRLILPELVAGRPIEPQELGDVIGVEVGLTGAAPENVEDAEGTDEGEVQDGTDAPA